MPPFILESNGPARHLRLIGDVTIEHARDLRAALLPALTEGAALAIDARELSRLDAAALQVLIAAAHAATSTEIVATSAAWTQAFARFGFDDSAFSTARVA